MRWMAYLGKGDYTSMLLGHDNSDICLLVTHEPDVVHLMEHIEQDNQVRIVSITVTGHLHVYTIRADGRDLAFTCVDHAILRLDGPLPPEIEAGG